jgi:outer membrane immunogenic protein
VHRTGKVLAAILITSAGISGAHAADLWIDHPPVIDVQPTTDWNGFYAGIFGGYGAGRATSTGVATGSVSPVDVHGALLGVTVGANAQFDSFVLGVEGDVAWSGIAGSTTCDGAPAFTCNGELDWVGSGKLRGGMVFDNVLLFGTAGLAFGGITASVDPIPGGATGTFSHGVWGWTIGAGAEMAVSDQISVKAEYAYYDFATVQAPNNTIANLGASDIKSSAHVAKLGVNYRF